MMHLKKHWRYVFAVLISAVMLSPFLVDWSPVANENLMFRAWFVSGLYSALSPELSFQWLSNIGYGVPRIGNPLFSSFYPPAYLGYWVAEPFSSYITWFACISLGLVGAWKLFECFSDDREITLLAGAAFVLSGILFISSVIGLYPERILFVPWTIYFFWKGFNEQKNVLLVVASVLHALHFFASTSFTWFYLSASIAFFMMGYFIYLLAPYANVAQNWMPAFKRMFVAGGVFFGLCAALIIIQILPVLEFDMFAVHRDQKFEDYVATGRFNPKSLFLAPFLFPGALEKSRQFFEFSNLSYLGWIPAFLCMVWYSAARRNQILGVTLLIAAIVFAAGGLTPIKEIIRMMPGMGSVRLSAFWFLALNFVVLLMVVRAAQKLGDEVSFLKARNVGFILLALSILWAIYLLFAKGAVFSAELLRPILVGLAVSVVLFAAQMGKIDRQGLLRGLLVIGLLDVGSWSIQSSFRERPGSDRTLVYLQNIQDRDFEHYIEVPNQGRALALCTKDNIGDASRLIVSGRNLDWAFNFSSFPLARTWDVVKRLGFSQRSACERIAIWSTAEAFFTPNRHALTRALNIRYFFLDGPEDKLFVEGLGFQHVAHDDYSGFDLYEDPFALPRAVVYPAAEVVLNFDDARTYVNEHGLSVSRALVERKSGQPLDIALRPQANKTAHPPVELVYTPTKVMVQTDNNSPTLLVVSDVVYPGWTATVDGEAADILPVNIVGRGVQLTAGSHEIVFEYHSVPLFWGAVVSGLAWLGVLLYFGGVIVSRIPTSGRQG
ncbi:hypothetical protein V5T82_08740 [Magnetovibrio sp. PR-2]|uniref:hypothetical protein n=1 Tax=Magnetovibrio sp. PR-2 TaxID=3120356 RepID=UPI002FCE6712